MFTVQQIKEAHSKTKTGADFPVYIQDIKKLGVIAFRFNVSDGKEIYYGTDSYQVESESKYEPVNIAEIVNKEQFSFELKEHQEGKTDFPHFLKISAENGIAYWEVDLNKYLCTYYDLEGNEILSEEIPH